MRPLAQRTIMTAALALSLMAAGAAQNSTGSAVPADGASATASAPAASGAAGQPQPPAQYPAQTTTAANTLDAAVTSSIVRRWR